MDRLWIVPPINAPSLVSTVVFLEEKLERNTIPSNAELKQLIQTMESLNKHIKESKLRVTKENIDTS